MGLIKKIKNRSRPNLKSLYAVRRRKKGEKAAAKTNASTLDEPLKVQAASNPREFSLDSLRSFDWLTSKIMDDFSLTNLGGSLPNLGSLSFFEKTEGAVTNDGDGDEAGTSVNESSVGGIGWGWFASCWGSPYMTDKTDDTSSTCGSSYNDDDDDQTGGSSQPSLSRINQVLQLPSHPDDVSEITTTPSIDMSDSDESECSGDETSL